jgi:hypothetical protein
MNIQKLRCRDSVEWTVFNLFHTLKHKTHRSNIYVFSYFVIEINSRIQCELLRTAGWEKLALDGHIWRRRTEESRAQNWTLMPH